MPRVGRPDKQPLLQLESFEKILSISLISVDCVMVTRHVIYIILFDPTENCEVDKVSNIISIIQKKRHA